MIEYVPGAFHPRLLCQLRGSVFPLACALALPAGLIAVLLEMYSEEVSESEFRILGLWDKDTVAGQVWSGVSSLLGFIVVFRTSQAYSRFWEGTTSMYQLSGEWFDAASSLISFCKCSKAEKTDIAVFQHTLVRLVSMLHAVVLMDLSANHLGKEDPKSSRAFELELIDAEGIDRESLLSINEAEEKVELIFHWINQLVVENNHRNTFSVAPPILSRAFQELAGGMVRYHEAMRIARIPLPFPYVQTLELLLVLHWFATPFLTSMWVRSEFWAGVLTFMQVFFMWSLNSIAAELENPFGEDVNDLPAQKLQQEMNRRLLLLIRPSTQRTARLSGKACLEEMSSEDGKNFTSLPHSIGLGKAGVAGMQVADARLNRRISLGMLREAIADEAVVEVDVLEVEMDQEPSTSTSKSKIDGEVRRTTKRQITIREVKPGTSLTGATPRSSIEGVPLPSLYSPFMGAEVTSELQKLVQTAEASRQELVELVAICDELRDCSRALGGFEVNGSIDPDRKALGSYSNGLVLAPTTAPRPLPDPALTSVPEGSPRWKRGGQQGSPPRQQSPRLQAAPAPEFGCCSAPTRGGRNAFSKSYA